MLWLWCQACNSFRLVLPDIISAFYVTTSRKIPDPEYLWEDLSMGLIRSEFDGYVNSSPVYRLVPGPLSGIGCLLIVCKEKLSIHKVLIVPYFKTINLAYSKVQ